MNEEHIFSDDGSAEKIKPGTKILKGRPAHFSLEDENLDPSKPLYLMMNLETSCSYRCPKCALEGEREKTRGNPLTLEQRQIILAQAKAAGIKSLAIAGLGEPTENFDLIRPVIEAADREGLITILFSTCNGLTPEKAAFFRDHNVSLIVSLDSLDPKTYRKLTGQGDLEKILKNVELLRRTYDETSIRMDDTKIVRLGINTTVTKDNEHELDEIRAFAGDDMQFIANPPMKRGQFDNDRLWKNLVGDETERLTRLARDKSETGGNSTITEGTCGYYARGISIDTDGEFMTCTYAGESVDQIQRNIQNTSGADQLLEHYESMRIRFRKLIDQIGYVPACPLRDTNAAPQKLVQIRLTSKDREPEKQARDTTKEILE